MPLDVGVGHGGQRQDGVRRPVPRRRDPRRRRAGRVRHVRGAAGGHPPQHAVVRVGHRGMGGGPPVGVRRRVTPADRHRLRRRRLRPDSPRPADHQRHRAHRGDARGHRLRRGPRRPVRPRGARPPGPVPAGRIARGGRGDHGDDGRAVRGLRPRGQARVRGVRGRQRGDPPQRPRRREAAADDRGPQDARVCPPEGRAPVHVARRRHRHRARGRGVVRIRDVDPPADVGRAGARRDAGRRAVREVAVVGGRSDGDGEVLPGGTLRRRRDRRRGARPAPLLRGEPRPTAPERGGVGRRPDGPGGERAAPDRRRRPRRRRRSRTTCSA